MKIEENKIEENKNFSKTFEEEKQDRSMYIHKELKNLKKNNYEKIYNKFDKSFVLKNKKTGAILEIRALTSIHACKLIGWNPKKTRLINVLDKSGELEVKEVVNAEGDFNPILE